MSAPPNLDFKTLFEGAPVPACVLDRDLTIVACSDMYLQTTLTERDKIVGRYVFDVFPENPEEVQATGASSLMTSFRRVLSSKTSDTMAVLKFDIRRPEEEGGGYEERYWSVVNTPILGADGQVDYIVNRVADVTEFVNLKTSAERAEAEVLRRAKEVQEANARLEAMNTELGALYEKTKELDRIKTRFFNTVSHELRTPLTLIVGPVDRLLLDTELDAQQRASLETVGRNARTLLRHVNDLLDVAKLEAGRMEVRYSETDMAYLVKVAAGHFESFAQERGVRLSVETPSALPAQVDAGKMQRILLNLLSNAFKFAPDGGRITCRLSAAGSYALLTVQDNGPGVPLDLREEIFEPFRQADDDLTRKGRGTGLGLAITREFLELHGGSVAVCDAPDGGALFEARVPLRAPAGEFVYAESDLDENGDDLRAALEDLALPPPSPVVEGGMDKACILVVEDNADMNRFIVEALSGRYRVASARNGREGLEKAQALMPDLILSDVMMPEMSGNQLLAELRVRPEFSDTPVMLLTAKSDEETRVGLLRTGAQDFLLKPFSTEELLARVANLVDAKRAQDVLTKGKRFSEERHRLFMETAPVGVFVLDGQGAILDANPGAEPILDLGVADMLGRRLSDLLHDVSPEADAADPMLSHGGGVRIGGVRKRGAAKGDGYLELNANPVKIEGGDFILCTLRNVTDEVKTEQQLRQAQKLDAVGQLTGGVAHDFNNILTVISATAEALSSALADNPKLTRLVESIDAAAERGAALTQRMLAFARRQPLKARALDVNEIVSRAADLLGRTLGEQVQVKTVLAGDLWSALADPSQLEDAILNLAVNARDAMPKGGRLLIETENVHLDQQFASQNADVKAGDYVSLVVTDAGTGMPPDVLERVFEPFFTTKEAGRGTGLGLSQVYGFAKQSGGHVQIYSETGHGTTVRLYLPRTANAATKATVEAPLPDSLNGSETILVVEDDPQVREASVMILRDLGYHVLEAEDGPAALDVLQAEPGIELLFTDMILPKGLSGSDVMREARKLRPELKVLFTSGYSEHFLKERGEADADIPLLSKPFRKRRLAEAVRELLDR